MPHGAFGFLEFVSEDKEITDIVGAIPDLKNVMQQKSRVRQAWKGLVNGRKQEQLDKSLRTRLVRRGVRVGPGPLLPVQESPEERQAIGLGEADAFAAAVYSNLSSAFGKNC